MYLAKLIEPQHIKASLGNGRTSGHIHPCSYQSTLMTQVGFFGTWAPMSLPHLSRILLGLRQSFLRNSGILDLAAPFNPSSFMSLTFSYPASFLLSLKWWGQPMCLLPNNSFLSSLPTRFTVKNGSRWGPLTWQNLQPYTESLQHQPDFLSSDQTDFSKHQPLNNFCDLEPVINIY